MDARQKRGMIRFHEKAEKAYRASGKVSEADEAKRMQENIEASCLCETPNLDGLAAKLHTCRNCGRRV
jgi:hypothetical protein